MQTHRGTIDSELVRFPLHLLELGWKNDERYSVKKDGTDLTLAIDTFKNRNQLSMIRDFFKKKILNAVKKNKISALIDENNFTWKAPEQTAQ